MNLYLISHPDLIEHEHEVVNALFEAGLDYFHLRKPAWDKNQLEGFIRKMNPKNIRKTIVHSHYELIGKYNLKGIHLPEKVRAEEGIKEVIKSAKKKNLSTSTSIHKVESLKECNQYDYVFLSPVFDSISKEGYKGSIALQEFIDSKKELKTQVIALGGIEESNILKVKEAGFEGAALHGAIWNNSTNGVETFNKIKSKLMEYSNV